MDMGYLRKDEKRMAGMGTEHALAMSLLFILVFLILTRTGFRGALGG